MAVPMSPCDGQMNSAEHADLPQRRGGRGPGDVFQIMASQRSKAGGKADSLSSGLSRLCNPEIPFGFPTTPPRILQSAACLCPKWWPSRHACKALETLGCPGPSPEDPNGHKGRPGPSRQGGQALDLKTHQSLGSPQAQDLKSHQSPTWKAQSPRNFITPISCPVLRCFLPEQRPPPSLVLPSWVFLV